MMHFVTKYLIYFIWKGHFIPKSKIPIFSLVCIAMYPSWFFWCELLSFGGGHGDACPLSNIMWLNGSQLVVLKESTKSLIKSFELHYIYVYGFFWLLLLFLCTLSTTNQVQFSLIILERRQTSLRPISQKLWTNSPRGQGGNMSFWFWSVCYMTEVNVLSFYCASQL